jgi:hypothetical protein
MSCGIIRVQKFSAGSVKGIEIHDTRAKDVSHTNKDIDFSKSEQNYNLHEPKQENFQKAVKNRVDQLVLKKAVRKDAKVMCQALVTSDKSFFDGISKERQEQYFKDSFNFLCERYGKENIISATVHMDEKTPHMHVNFVPVTADGRLSAKDVIGGRKDLNEFQTAFFERVAKGYGLERGVEGSATKHQTVAEFKTSTAKAELAELETIKGKTMDDISSLREKLVNAQKGLDKSKEVLNVVESRKKGLEDEIAALETKRETLTAEEVSELKGTKTLTGGLKGVTFKEYQALKATAENNHELYEIAKKAESKTAEAAKTANSLKNEIQAILEVLKNHFPQTHEKIMDFLEKRRGKRQNETRQPKIKTFDEIQKEINAVKKKKPSFDEKMALAKERTKNQPQRSKTQNFNRDER